MGPPCFTVPGTIFLHLPRKTTLMPCSSSAPVAWTVYCWEPLRVSSTGFVGSISLRASLLKSRKGTSCSMLPKRPGDPLSYSPRMPGPLMVSVMASISGRVTSPVMPTRRFPERYILKSLMISGMPAIAIFNYLPSMPP